MSHLLWKYYWDNDVDKFRHLLAPTAFGGQHASRNPVTAVGSLGASPVGIGTSPKATKSRKASGYGTSLGNWKNTGTAFGKSEVNSRDHAGLTLLLRASASTDPCAIQFVQALLEHPAVDLYAQDTESGWNALHRSLYVGNISIARLLLERERRDLVGETLGSSISRVGQLIKTKDHEGNAPFDVYNSTIAVRTLEAVLDADGSDSGSDSFEVMPGDYHNPHGISVDANALTHGDELFMFGSNKNLSLGVGDEDDRQYPERIQLTRPDNLLRTLYEDALGGSETDASFPKPRLRNLDDIPALIKYQPLVIQDVVLSKLHTAILTTDPISNLYVCGVGRGGRLGLGDENTQFRFRPVQGGLADKKVLHVALGQNHTMAVTENGELWTWGSNSNSQLGYILPPPTKNDEEPMSTTPRQVFGSLKKEWAQGVAASSIHSVAHTGSSLYCWGKNLGQLALMDSDSRSLESQQMPRKVAASLFSCPIAMVSAIDKATTCLLTNNTVCVFTNYGYNIVKFPLPDVFSNHITRTNQAAPIRHDISRTQINYVASGGETIAAITAQGDLFTMSLNHKTDISSTVSTTNPSKIKGALTQPQRVWRAGIDGVRSVNVGENGSVIICTDSGAVWRRVKRAKAKDANLPGSVDAKRKDFKFQRVPSITNVVTVRSSTFGAFAAVRKDCRVMEQITVGEQSLWHDLAPLSALREFRASQPSVAEEKDVSTFWKSEALVEILGPLPLEILRSANLESDLLQYFQSHSHSCDGYDILARTTSSPEVQIPIHGWILAARSQTLRKSLKAFRKEGYSEVNETFAIEELDGKAVISFQNLDLLTLLNIVVYAYNDVVVPAWNFTRQTSSLAYRYRQVRSELMKTATKLNMMKLEAAARQQTTVIKALDKDIKIAMLDPVFFEDADTLLELEDAEVSVHSQIICQRCPFFERMFHGRARGHWLANRRNEETPADKVRIDMKHVNPDAFRYVLRYLYCDIGVDLFNDVVSANLDEFCELVMEVLSVADELMLDRLSQICQFILARFVTIRNISYLLNEIGPFSVPNFKNAGLEYICLQMESMLENHLLDNLEENLLAELDLIVRENQLARCPIARSGRAEALLLELYPDLAQDIEEERTRRVKEMAFKMSQREEDRKFSSPLKGKYGSLDDFGSMSPSVEKASKKVGGVRNQPFSPNLQPKEPHGDLIFDMEDDDGASTLGSLSPTPQLRRTVSEEEKTDLDEIPTMASPWRIPVRSKADDFGQSTLPGSSEQIEVRTPSDTPITPQRGGNPWGSTPLQTLRLDLRDIMDESSTKSNISARLAAGKSKDIASKTSAAKMSQKERKKKHQLEVAAQVAQATHADLPKTAWEPPSSDSKPAPWKVVRPSVETPSLFTKIPVAPDQGSTSKPSSFNIKHRVESDASAKSISRRAASPDTRFSGQSRINSSPSAPTSSTVPIQKPALVPHSKSYITPSKKVEPALNLSMADIIGQQKREQEIVREAVAKRSLQEIQQEQAFQEWWDQESRRTQEEESRRLTREKDKDSGKRRRGRGGKPKAAGESRNAGPNADTDSGASSHTHPRGKGVRERGIQA
jgi:inhibitor of Bruton tyrosine kinase